MAPPHFSPTGGARAKRQTDTAPSAMFPDFIKKNRSCDFKKSFSTDNSEYPTLERPGFISKSVKLRYCKEWNQFPNIFQLSPQTVTEEDTGNPQPVLVEM